jgi:TolB protein
MRVAALALLVPSLVAAQQPAPPAINGGLPSVNPKTSQIAFLSNRDGQHDIYVVNADGTGFRRVTNDATRKDAPSWTGNGTELLFASGTMDTTSLYAVNVASGSKRKLAEFAGRGAALSNSGKRLAFSQGAFQQSKFVIAAPDGSNPRAVTDGKSPAFNFVWSPDDTQLAYASLAMDSTRALTIWLVNADGANARRILQLTPSDGSPQWPAWSPDGKRLAIQVGKYSRDRATNTAHIWLIDVATGRATKLAAHDRAYLDETPSWLPDGRHIAFQSDRSGRMEIWIMNDDGTGARQITK